MQCCAWSPHRFWSLWITKIAKIGISWERNNDFSSNKKIHSLYTLGYDMKKWLSSRGNLYTLINCTALKNTYFANIISFEIQARLLALLATNMFCSFTIPSTDFLEWIWLMSIFQIWLSNIYKSKNLPNLANEISKSFFVVIRPRLLNFILPVLKITLIQIWKFASIFVFICRKYAENFILKHLLLFWDMRMSNIWKVCLQRFRNKRIW